MKSTQKKKEKFKHGRLADLRPRSSPVGYESSRYSGSCTISASSKRDRKPSPALQDDDSESHKSSLISLLRSAFITEKHRANLSFRPKKSSS